MVTEFLKSSIHLYNPETGVYLNSYASHNAAEEALGLYRGAISDALRRKTTRGKILCSKIKYEIYPGFFGSVENVETKQEPVIKNGNKTSTILTEEELRIKHDMFFRVMQFIRNIPKGKYIEETQMLRELGILGKPRFRDAISRPELKEYKGKVDGIVYYSQTESISKLKQEGVLQ